MGAPNVTFSATRNKISNAAGYDSIGVTFSADAACQAFECRATKAGEKWGVGVGQLLASFSGTPANTTRTFEIYDEYLVHGDGDYRISLYVQGTDGSWNDTINFSTSQNEMFITADGLVFQCRKGDT